MEHLLDGFLSWAWSRHHNPLSWYIRLLFLLPFCYFAYKRSTWGIVLTLFALATSMVWFPSRNGRTTGHSSFWRDGEGLSYGPLDPYEGALGSAGAGMPSGVGPGFLEEIPSLRVGCSRLDCADKIAWSFYYGGESELALLPSALVGLIACQAAVLYVVYRVRGKLSL